MNNWQPEKKQVLAAARKMIETGLVVGTCGNVSLRLPPEGNRELLAITPTSRYYDRLDFDDIQVIDFEAVPVEGNLPPSVESMLHIGIYKARKRINAVMHTHSVFASAISVAGLEIPPILEDQVTFLGGEIKLAQHALTGSEEMEKNVIAALENRNAVLLPNHGAIGIGRNLREAFNACGLLEKTAKIYYLALSLGKVNPLPDQALKMGKAFFTMLQSQTE